MSELQLNKDFVLREVCGLNVVLPTGANVKDFGGALNLNDTAALPLWRRMTLRLRRPLPMYRKPSTR